MLVTSPASVGLIITSVVRLVPSPDIPGMTFQRTLSPSVTGGCTTSPGCSSSAHTIRGAHTTEGMVAP